MHPYTDAEAVLRQGQIHSVELANLGGNHQPKYRVTFAGGVVAVGKPKGGLRDVPDAERFECAAFSIAKDLNWAEWVTPAVLRSITAPEGGPPVDTALVLWFENHELAPDPLRLPEEQVWRAAAFDYVIEHGDRTANWLGVTQVDGTLSLRLIDHGYAFGAANRPLSSRFVQTVSGRARPQWLDSELREWLDHQWAPEVGVLLGSELTASIRSRAEGLLGEAVFPA